MENRSREKQLKFRVTEQENQLILAKMESAGIKTKEVYLRKMAIDGYIIKKDYSELRELTQEINKIGVNINQVAKRANESRLVNVEDIEHLQKRMDEIWQLLRSKVLNQR